MVTREIPCDLVARFEKWRLIDRRVFEIRNKSENSYLNLKSEAPGTSTYADSVMAMIGSCVCNDLPDSKVHEANMGPIWGRQDPDGPHVGPMNFAIWVMI